MHQRAEVYYEPTRPKIQLIKDILWFLGRLLIKKIN